MCLMFVVAMVLQWRVCVLESTWPSQEIHKALQLATPSLLVLDDGTSGLAAIVHLPACATIVLRVDDFIPATTTTVSRLEPPSVPVVHVASIVRTAVDHEDDGNMRTTFPAVSAEAFVDGPREARLPVSITFSSGSSGGAPKGVVMRSRMVWEEVQTALYDVPIIALSKASPAWATDQRAVLHTLTSGGRIGFVPRSSPTPFDYMRVFRPSLFVSLVPGHADLLLQQFDIAKDEAIADLSKRHHALTPRQVEGRATAAAAQHAYAAIGGVVSRLTVGGATVNPHVLHRLQQCMPCEVIETYGITEGGGIGSASEGGGIRVSRDIRVKLKDIEGFTSADTPHPRGELWLRGPMTVNADDYICDDARVPAARYDEEGFLNTGDIAVRFTDGTYGIIGRTSSLLKLPNGQFFSPEQVENAIGELPPPFHRSFVTLYENEPAALLEMMACSTMTSLSDASADVTAVLHMIRDRCAAQGLPVHWVPTRVFPDRSSIPWDTLVTTTKKMSRPLFTRHFTECLSSYRDFPCPPYGPGDRESTMDTTISAEDRFIEELFHQVGLWSEGCTADVKRLCTLQSVGFDSVKMAKALTMLKSRFRHHPTVVDGLVRIASDPSYGTVGQLVDLCTVAPAAVRSLTPSTGATTGEKSVPLKATTTVPEHRVDAGALPVEGRDAHPQAPHVATLTAAAIQDGPHMEFDRTGVPTMIRRVERALLRAIVAPPPGGPDATQEQACPYAVLLTGATGFVGRWLCAALAARDDIATVVCLVRSHGKTLDDARRELMQRLGRMGLVSPVHLDKVRVIVGDCSLPNAGLVDTTVLSGVRSIVHCAAKVKSWSHANGLEDLLTHNSEGTLHLANLALSLRVESILYVSTASVPEGVVSPPPQGSSCSAVPITLGDEVNEVLFGMTPYAVSKAMGETILRAAAARGNMTLVVCRPCLVTPSASCPADINADDWLFRFFDTVRDTGVAPLITNDMSFPLNRPQPYCPVDELCTNMVTAWYTARTQDRPSNYHMSPSSSVMFPFDRRRITQLSYVIDTVRQHYHDEAFECVPLHIFCVAVRMAVPPPPFFPLLQEFGESKLDQLEWSTATTRQIRRQKQAAVPTSMESLTVPAGVVERFMCS